MEFEFTDYIWIDEKDLDEIIKRVKNGESFSKVYSDISMGWDDEFYYVAYLAKKQVEKYVMSKIKEG